MKKLIISMIALFLLIGGTVCAQNAGGQRATPEERAKAQGEAAKTALTLTDDQTAKVVTILLNVRKQMDSIRTANTGADQATMMPKMTALNAARDAKIKAILTPAQQTVFEAKKAEIFPMRGGRPAAPAQQ